MLRGSDIMANIESCRQRLTALGTEGIQSLDACHLLQDRLRALKREILAELMEIRTRVSAQAREPLGPRPTLKEAWDRREEGAEGLLADMKSRVARLLETDTQDAVLEWSELNQEIDGRLAYLAELELQLSPPAKMPATRTGSDDDVYARVGAALRQERKTGPFCPHCGRKTRDSDRFCGHCGHEL
jgi:hypothetical protein